MPNPIAHPAVAVPFTRAGLVLSALVIGSVAPDFGYAIPMTNPYFMNTASGLILFDVPAGFALLWLFQMAFALRCPRQPAAASSQASAGILLWTAQTIRHDRAVPAGWLDHSRGLGFVHT